MPMQIAGFPNYDAYLAEVARQVAEQAKTLGGPVWPGWAGQTPVPGSLGSYMEKVTTQAGTRDPNVISGVLPAPPSPAPAPAPALGTIRPPAGANPLNAAAPTGGGAPSGGVTPTPAAARPGPLGQMVGTTAQNTNVAASGGGKGGGTTRSLSASGPPEFQFPYISKGLEEANRLYSSPGPQIYPFSTVAPFTAPEQQGQQSAMTAAGGALPQLAQGTMNAFNFGTTTALDPNSNPYFKSAVNAAIEPVFQQLTQQVLPNVRNSFVGAGGYGGTRQSLAEALAVDAATKSALNTTAQMGNQAYGQGLQTMLGTLGMAPTVGQAQLAPAATMSAVGGQQRELENARLMEEASKYMYNQNLPYNKLMEFMNIVARPYGGQAASTVEAPPVGTPEQIASMGLGLLPFITQLWKIFK